MGWSSLVARRRRPSVETVGGYARIDDFYDKTEVQLRNMAAAVFAGPYIDIMAT